jgi:hypothetical protein
MPGVPAQLVVFVSGLPGEHRRQIGSRRGTRALSCRKQAVFVLAWFQDEPDTRRLGNGSAISQATACRYLREGIDVTAATAPAGSPGGPPAGALATPGRRLDDAVAEAGDRAVFSCL